MRFVTGMLCLLGALWIPGGISAQLSPHEVLQRADEARGNLAGVEWQVSVVVAERGRQSEMVFHVQARGFEILATTIEPAKDRGNKLLVSNGNMWFAKPGWKRPISISQRQKLMGVVANGDLASTNYANDYTVAGVAEDTLNHEPCFVYNLKANTNRVTYDRIEYWVSKERLVGIKADCFTVSGKKIKTATMDYENRVWINGEQRPFISRLRIQDLLVSGDETIMTFSEPRLREIPESVFDLKVAFPGSPG